MGRAPCSVPDCGKPSHAFGYCKLHYTRWKRHGDPHHVIVKNRNVCAVDDCGGWVHIKGYCRSHHRKMVLYGDPLTPDKKATREQTTSFIETVLASNTDECILWPYSTTNGYGAYNGTIGEFRITKAHVFVCTAAHGPKPDPALFACHSCGIPACVNPKHLRWATPKENTADREKHGTKRIGEQNGRAKLTEDQVRAIRFEYGRGGVSKNTLSKKYEVSWPVIDGIVTGRGWKHV